MPVYTGVHWEKLYRRTAQLSKTDKYFYVVGHCTLESVLKLESNHLTNIHIKPNMCKIYTYEISIRAVLNARDVHMFTENT